MYIEKIFLNAKAVYKNKTYQEQAIKDFSYVYDQLMKLNCSVLDSQKLYMGLFTSIILYYNSMQKCAAEEDTGYIEKAMEYAKRYFTLCPDDLASYSELIVALQGAVYYTEAYELCDWLYKQNGEKRILALSHLTHGHAFVADGFISKETYAAYEKELDEMLKNKRQP